MWSAHMKVFIVHYFHDTVCFVNIFLSVRFWILSCTTKNEMAKNKETINNELIELVARYLQV